MILTKRVRIWHRRVQEKGPRKTSARGKNSRVATRKLFCRVVSNLEGKMIERKRSFDFFLSFRWEWIERPLVRNLRDPRGNIPKSLAIFKVGWEVGAGGEASTMCAEFIVDECARGWKWKKTDFSTFTIKRFVNSEGGAAWERILWSSRWCEIRIRHDSEVL